MIVTSRDDASVTHVTALVLQYLRVLVVQARIVYDTTQRIKLDRIQTHSAPFALEPGHG
jgi:hypothetical protein